MAFYVDNGYPVFTGTDGLPLDDGYIFIGVENLNPLSNPQAVFWDSALSIPATDIRTKGGYAMYEGSPGRIYSQEAYSLLVQDSDGATVYYLPSSSDPFASGAPGAVGLPIGGVIPTDGETFLGFLDLGSENVSQETYNELFSTDVELIVDNGDGTFNILNSGYSTGWVANNDWDDATITIFHDLKKQLPDLDVDMYVSSLGTDVSALKVMDVSFDSSSGSNEYRGVTLYAAGVDSVVFHTGTDGIDVIDTDGTQLTLTDQSWYYKVVVKRKGLPYPAQIKAKEIVQNLQVTGDIPLGMSLPYPLEESPFGYLPWAFDNAVEISAYPGLYAVVGDQYEAQHVAAGDPAIVGPNSFYPTPVPGEYTRSALPNITFTDAEVTDAVDDVVTLPAAPWRGNLRNGTKYRFEVVDGTAPTGLTDGTEYYVATTATTIQFFASESDAISATSAIQVTDTGTGDFRLTQKALSLDDAFQGHIHEAWSLSDSEVTGAAERLAPSDVGGAISDGVGEALTDGTNGAPRVSNETRPSTVVQFMHIKALPIQYTVPELNVAIDALFDEYAQDNNFSGVSSDSVFPTADLILGQRHYRTDLDRFFTWTGSEWVEV